MLFVFTKGKQGPLANKSDQRRSQKRIKEKKKKGPQDEPPSYSTAYVVGPGRFGLGSRVGVRARDLPVVGSPPDPR